VKFLAAVLATVSIVLTPLVHGSPVDPSSPGFWDNGDFDDVILFLTSGLELLDPGARPLILASEAMSERMIEGPTGLVPQGAYDPGTARAPPAK
jgi:hypothetical protein